MARTLSSGRVSVSIAATITNTLTDGSTASSSISGSASRSLSNGVSANQANRAWQKKSATLSSGASTVIDLYDFVGEDVGAGDGNDAIGQAMSPVEEIAAILIVNENAVTADGILEVEPDSSNGWTPIGTHTAATGGGLRGQGILLKSQTAEAGFDVTDASSHRLKLTANSADVTYSVYVLGRHDDEESSSSTSSQSGSSQSSSGSSSSTSSASSASSSSVSSSSSTSSLISSVSSSSWSSQSSSLSSISTSSSSTSSSSFSSSSPSGA